MSPSSKSKSKEKMARKETQKVLLKPSGPANAGAGNPASAYNPVSGTVITIEALPSPSVSSINTNGHFHNIDEMDDTCVLHGTGIDSDSVSNNGSWSGDSEDHKEKNSTPVQQETIPGANNDKREKIRQKNGKKHQRQKEKRAQELHERCCGYITSRKLEARVQQLVSMGFSNERATGALMMNEGKLEESIAWLLEAGEDADKHRDQNVGGWNLKIDIAEELAWIADMETQYRCTKQEVERAVIASEGNLEKAAESLSALKQDPPNTPLKPEEIDDPPTVNNGKLPVSLSQNVGRPVPKSNLTSSLQVRRDDKDLNYPRAAIPSLGSSESGSRIVQPLNKMQPKSDWVKLQQAAMPADKRWSNAGSHPSVSYSLASPLQVPPLRAKAESHLAAAASEYKSIQPIIREPVIMMQRPYSVNSKQVSATSISSSPPGIAAGWYPTNSVEIMRSDGLLTHLSSTISSSPNNSSSNQMLLQLQNQHQHHLVPGSSPRDTPGRGNGLWSRVGASPTLAAASSLGLFSGLGVTTFSGASSPVDWSAAASMSQLDYTNIDWSLDRVSSSPTTNGWWPGSGSLANGTQLFDSSVSALGAKLALRSMANVNGVTVLQDGRMTGMETSASGSREWTSPFEGKDLFSLPRQFVSSPSL